MKNYVHINIATVSQSSSEAYIQSKSIITAKSIRTNYAGNCTFMIYEEGNSLRTIEITQSIENICSQLNEDNINTIFLHLSKDNGNVMCVVDKINRIDTFKGASKGSIIYFANEKVNYFLVNESVQLVVKKIEESYKHEVE